MTKANPERVILFKLTREHLKLLGRMYVSWNDCEAGAPMIDPKRPYGNSFVYADMHEILTGETIGKQDSKRADLTVTEYQKYATLHAEMQIALQVVLSSGRFQTGYYRLHTEYGHAWRPYRGKVR